MPEGGVTHKELNAALTAQTNAIVNKINRSEDSLKNTIKEHKQDFKEDLQAVDERVTHIERRNRWENFFASVATFFAMIIYGRVSGG